MKAGKAKVNHKTIFRIRILVYNVQKFTYLPEALGTSEARATSRFIFPRSERYLFLSVLPFDISNRVVHLYNGFRVSEAFTG